jgi:hypothetical protein
MLIAVSEEHNEDCNWEHDSETSLWEPYRHMSSISTGIFMLMENWVSKAFVNRILSVSASFDANIVIAYILSVLLPLPSPLHSLSPPPHLFTFSLSPSVPARMHKLIANIISRLPQIAITKPTQRFALPNIKLSTSPAVSKDIIGNTITTIYCVILS